MWVLRRRGVRAACYGPGVGGWCRLAVYNDSRRPVTVTHLWFDVGPAPVHVLNDDIRNGVTLPARLEPGWSWTVEVDAGRLFPAGTGGLGRAGRVRLHTGRVVESRPGWPPRRRRAPGAPAG